MKIRNSTNKDLPRVKELVHELHDYVQVYDADMPKADLIIDSYFDYLLKRVEESNGAIHIAEIDNEIVGVCIQFGRVLNDEPDEIKFYYSYISDLIVTENHRNLNIGKHLLLAAEAYAKSLSVESISLSAFCQNEAAIKFYQKNEYQSRVITLRKNIK